MNKGLSLIEILVVITVFAVLGIIISTSIILSLQGSQKSLGVVAARENLDYATGIIERQLRNANSIPDCLGLNPSPNPDTSTINFIDQNGNPSSFTCVLTGTSTEAGYIASGSANLRLTSPQVAISACSFTIACGSPGSVNPPYVDVSLTAHPVNLTGAQSSTLTNSVRIYLRNY